MTRAVLGTVAVCLVACPAAAAHGGGGAETGYRSTVTHVTPQGTGVNVQVVEGDDQLRLTNSLGRRVVVFGYEGEPYLLFEGKRVFRNERSPATYLNQDRYANVKVPAIADPEARPEWVPLATAPTYTWHDHRIHWMSPTAPPAVRDAKGKPHHIFDWRVNGTVDSRRLSIAGSLDWVPSDGSAQPAWVIGLAAVVGLGLVGLGLALWRKRVRNRLA